MAGLVVAGSGRRRALLPAVLGVVLAGAALAYWAASGGGTASATTGTTTSTLTLSPATPTAQLYPGGQASVVLTVTNPNVVPVRIGSLIRDTGQGNSGFGVDGAHSACNVAALSFTTQTNGGAGWTVPGGSAIAITLTNALSMATTAANACQGASFTVYLQATP